MRHWKFLVIVFVLVTIVSCSRRKEAAIEPPPVTEPPTAAEPQDTQPLPPVSEPAQPPPAPPKKALPPPAPKPKAVSPGDASALKIVESGVKKMNAGNFEEAEQYFEQALRVSPNNGRPYYYLGVLASKQKEYDRALAFLAQAEVHLHNDAFWMSQILLQQGLVFKAQNQNGQAIQKLREAVAKDPNNTWAKKELDALTNRK